jgi:DTW domain-containing protein YfiP
MAPQLTIDTNSRSNYALRRAEAELTEAFQIAEYRLTCDMRQAGATAEAIAAAIEQSRQRYAAAVPPLLEQVRLAFRPIQSEATDAQ